MRKLFILALVLSAFLPFSNASKSEANIVDSTITEKADTAIINSILYQLKDNQQKILDKQDTLINLLN